ncbi:MAG TPA: cytochrome b [Cellvibrionaceae bacterium]|nr:cytochrome b [Cellvibrionaceae bacterium]
MPFKNTEKTYGLLAIAFHWLSALTVFGLFGLGLWMCSLDYYHPWYKQGPDLHRSIGVLLVITTVLRLIWRSLNITPAGEPGLRWQLNLARITHGLLYLWFFLMLISGYLITTAKGQALEVFNWFVIPAFITGIENLEDTAGVVHWLLACAFMSLVAVHAGAAVYHHVIKRDGTLRRMLGRT